jgi:ribosomal-protein-alanine N-acetyltransferase
MSLPMSEPPVAIRGMTHEDLAQVSDIERRSYDFPWSHGVFRDCLLAGYQCVTLERAGRGPGTASS